MSPYQQVIEQLKTNPKTWLVTGVAGFIGSNLLETLLKVNQQVVGLDNYATGKKVNLDGVKNAVSAAQWKSFRMIDGSITDFSTCATATKGVDLVLHQAALGSVPRSVEEPLTAHASNVTGFINMLTAARDAKIQRFVYASSSAVYGDHPGLPKVESQIGNCLSPYAANKYINELYANVFAQCYGMQCVGLRYFNVFGPRQDPDGAYAAVIPKWIATMIKNEPVYINGDGETSRDFCFIANVVQANILAALSNKPEAMNQAYNVAVQARTTLNQLFEVLRSRLQPHYPYLQNYAPVYREFRAGDIRHSHADISKAKQLLNYEPTHSMEQGLDEALEWYRLNV